MSLVELAEQKRLPRFQYMDAETCDWIAAHNPSYSLEGRVSLHPRLGWLGTVQINTEWLLESRITDSLHGLRHLWRCACYSLYLASLLNMDDRAARNLLVASLLHDIRREDDKGDADHGRRAAQWLRENSQEIEEYMRLQFEADDVEAMAVAIELHEAPYSELTAEQKARYRKHERIVDALKTADALDRYRMPKLKWWINDDHLRLIPPDWLKQVAFNLVLSSERNFLKDHDSRRGVLAALNEGERL